MLLVVDIGNTNITFGIYKDDELISTFRITTKISRTSDEFGIIMTDLIKTRGKSEVDEVDAVIIASVVPDVMHSFTSGVIKYLNVNPIIVGPGTKTGIKIQMTNPREVGADRVVDAVAAYDLYGGPLIVIDYGTATTYDYVTADGVFAGGVTAPGIRISAAALWRDAAKLPEIAIAKPDNIIGKDTISSMQAGLIHGRIGETEYVIEKIKEEAGESDMKVIATGGLGKLISENTDKIQIYDANLTLKGLKLVYDKEKNR